MLFIIHIMLTKPGQLVIFKYNEFT